MNINLYPFNNKFIIEHEKLIGKGNSSIICKFKYNNKQYIIKYFTNKYNNNNFKEFTYLNELFNNNLSYKCYGYNHITFYIDNMLINNISIYNYIKGNNLKTYLNNNLFDINIYYNLLNYIDLLHNKYILHNDLILSNILIDKYKKIYIIDYGECYCYYNKQYISEYYINEKIINNMKKDIYNNYYVCYDNYKINYNNNFFITKLNKACKFYLKYIKCIDKFNIFVSIIINYYLNNNNISINTRKKQTKKYFINIFSQFLINNNNNNYKLNDKLFKYLIFNKFSKRLNIPLYIFTLFKFNKLNNKTLQQLYNIYICIINDIDFLNILSNINDNNKIIIKNIKKILNNIEQPYNFNNLSNLDILILCIIHFSLNIYYRKLPNNILLHFTYLFMDNDNNLNIYNKKYLPIIEYINNLSNIKILNNDNNIKLDLILFNNLLLI